MVLTASNGGYTTTPNHRQNRRRERPGSRTRRTITRKAAMQAEFSEGLIDAFDLDVRFPTDRSNPSPLLRQNFDNAWQKWKVREEEQKMEREERERKLLVELEKEQLNLFGGEVDDDELRRLGILYDANSLDLRKSLSTLFSQTAPEPKSYPSYTIQQMKPRRPRRQSTWQGLPLNLSLSNLRDDHDLARLLSSVNPPPRVVPTNLEQAQAQTPSQTSLSSVDKSPTTQQSLPKSSALPLALVSSLTSPVNELSFCSPQPCIPPHSLAQEDWTFITPTVISGEHTHPSVATTPCSEAETWILLGDDL